jgi:hypothetical protein
MPQSEYINQIELSESSRRLTLDSVGWRARGFYFH